jgi:hypothetical protein
MNKDYEDFIKIIKAVLQIYKNDQDKKYIKNILALTVRMLENISPIKVSKKAQKLANERGLGPLQQFNWQKQNKVNGMKDFKRKIFHWEHYYPVEQIIQELLSINKINNDSIYSVIKKVEIVWILKEENQKLDKMFRSKRPNPSLAYKKAGIKIMSIK